MKINVVRLSKSPERFLKENFFQGDVTLTTHISKALKYELMCEAYEVAKTLRFYWPEACASEYDHYNGESDEESCTDIVKDGKYLDRTASTEELVAIKQIISEVIQLSGYGPGYLKKLRQHLQQLSDIYNEP